MKEVVLASSPEGQRLLQAASAAGLSQYSDLQANWENQIYGTHCGIASCVIIFNTSAKTHFQERRLTQDEADDFVMSYMIESEERMRYGLSLHQVSELFQYYAFKIVKEVQETEAVNIASAFRVRFPLFSRAHFSHPC